MFSALPGKPGVVVAKSDLRRRHGPARAQVDDHAVEVAVGRLRRRLPPEFQVATVAKRGYRLVAAGDLPVSGSDLTTADAVTAVR